MKRNHIRGLVMGAMFCAMIFVATLIQVPAPGVGNVNLGDGMIILSAWILGGPWAILASALGAALADLATGYVIYAPATLLIKGAMAALAIGLGKWLPRCKMPSVLGRILSAVCVEIVMVLGYFLWEAFALSLGWGALASIPFNAVQGGFAIVLSLVAYAILVRVKPKK